MKANHHKIVNRSRFCGCRYITYNKIAAKKVRWNRMPRPAKISLSLKAGHYKSWKSFTDDARARKQLAGNCSSFPEQVLKHLTSDGI